MNAVQVPEREGSYRWYYADAVCEDVTAVCIFMVGSLFSTRYARGGSPRAHAAVNFAVYRGGERLAWVLSEYPALQFTDSSLRIGGSTLTYLDARRLELVVDERTAIFGRRLQARFELQALCAPLAPVTLVEGLSHRWHPIAPRAVAKVSVPSLGVELEGAHAYHDGNDGDVPLGTDLRGWEWERSHDREQTVVTYRPWDSAEGIRVVAGAASRAERVPADAAVRSTTGWGLEVTPAVELLESSPFYARHQAHDGRRHTLGEVADFTRFRSPWIRWMARLRTRMERAA